MAYVRIEGKDTILFDMDDTLYPETQYVLSGFRAVSLWAETEFGIPCKQGLSQLEQLFYSGVRNNTFNLFLAENGILEDSCVTEMVEIYRLHRPILTPFPEVEKVLVQLLPRYRFGIITDGYFEVQKKKWEALALHKFFSAVIFSDTWGKDHWKPDHQPYLEAMKLLATAPGSVIYVGDNPNKDFIGAKELGLFTVMVEREGGVYSHISPPSPSHVADIKITDLEQLTAFL